MVRRLYPLNALRAFEAAARHLSFVRAAEELHVTPAAISHQVKTLEAFLEVALFRRRARGLLLTEVGQEILPDLRDGFATLDRAMDRVRQAGTRPTLTVSVAPVFAAKWLAPRLRDFGEAHPDIDVRISAGLAAADFQRDDVDAAIRFGRGDYPGMRVVKLFDEAVTPMCGPRIVDAAPLRRPEDLADHVLLHDDSLQFDRDAPTWATWLKAAGVTTVDPARGTHFSHPDHSLQAAIDGAGVVLGWRNLAAADLTAGRLIAPFDLVLPMGLGFHLVCPEHHAIRPGLAPFRDWLLAEVGAA